MGNVKLKHVLFLILLIGITLSAEDEKTPDKKVPAAKEGDAKGAPAVPKDERSRWQKAKDATKQFAARGKNLAKNSVIGQGGIKVFNKVGGWLDSGASAENKANAKKTADMAAGKADNIIGDNAVKEGPTLDGEKVNMAVSEDDLTDKMDDGAQYEGPTAEEIKYSSNIDFEKDKYWIDQIGKTYWRSLTDDGTNDPEVFIERPNLFVFKDLPEECWVFDDTQNAFAEMKEVNTVWDKAETKTEETSKKSETSGSVALPFASASMRKSSSVNKKSTTSTNDDGNQNEIRQGYKLTFRKYGIHDRCIRWLPYSMDFLYLFERLPMNPKTMEERKLYRQFLADFGNRVVMELTTGLEFVSTTTADTKASSGQRKASESACSEAAMSATVGAGPVSASASASFGSCGSSSSANNAYHGTATSNNIFEVKGGKPSLRAVLTASRMKSSIKTWLASGQSDPSYNIIVKHSAPFIWSVLQRTFETNSPHWIRADNLKTIFYMTIEAEKIQNGVPMPSCAMLNVKYDAETASKIQTVDGIAGPAQCQAVGFQTDYDYYMFNFGENTKCLLIKTEDIKELDYSKVSGARSIWISGPVKCDPNVADTPICSKSGLFVEGKMVWGERFTIATESPSRCQFQCLHMQGCS